MQMLIFAIKDTKAEEFNPPFFQARKELALRLFRTEINRGDSQNVAYLYPQDFQLYELGTWDTTTGEISAHLKPELVATGESMKAKP